MGRDLGSIADIQTQDVERSEQDKERLEEAKVAQARTKEGPERLAIGGLPGALIASGLPGRVQAEKDIQERQAVLPELRRELEKDPSNENIQDRILGTFVKGGKVALKSLQLADERVQGAIAAPLFELQDPRRQGIVQDTALSILQGVQGKRRARFEDIITSKLPEIKIGEVDVRKPIAVIGGLATEIAGGAKIASIADGILKGGPQTLKTIQKTWELAQETKSTAGKAIANLFASKIGKKTIDATRKFRSSTDPNKTTSLGEIIKNLPEGVLKKILKSPKTFEVIGNAKTGVVSLTAKNIWNLRKALDDLITEGEFAGKVTKIGKQKIINSTNEIRSVLANVDKQVAPLMERFSTLANSIRDTGKILLKGGKVVVNKAGQVLKKNGEPADLETLQNFSNLFQGGARMLKDIRLLNRNRATTNLASLGVKAAVGGAIFSRFLQRPVREVIGPEPRTSGGGGG